jgi:lysyl-tRNA synthetase class 2
MEFDSSAIRAVDYDAARRQLTVRFVSGETYVYDDVPRHLHQAFLGAESKGRFFGAQIRDRFAFRKLTRRGR